MKKESIVLTILDAISNEILDIKHFESFNSKSIDNYIKKFLNSSSTIEIEKTTIIHENSLHSLVSTSLFKKDNISNYLKFNNNILKSDIYEFDVIHNNEVVNVFIPNNNDYSIFNKNYYNNVEHYHKTSLLIDTLIKLDINKETANAYINLNKDTFHFIYIKKNKIQFINTFDFTSAEDLIYYILFCMEQLELNPEKIQTSISGTIFKEYYEIIYKYIRNVSVYNSNLSSESKYYSNYKNQILITY